MSESVYNKQIKSIKEIVCNESEDYVNQQFAAQLYGSCCYFELADYVNKHLNLSCR